MSTNTLAVQPDTVTIGGVTYVRRDDAEPRNSTIRIVILQRGWVAVGRWSRDGDDCALDNAYVIRVWGTTKGLGQLALEGPQSSTKLDKAGRMDFHALTVVATLNAREDLWDSVLV